MCPYFFHIEVFYEHYQSKLSIWGVIPECVCMKKLELEGIMVFCVLSYNGVCTFENLNLSGEKVKYFIL